MMWLNDIVAQACCEADLPLKAHTVLDSHQFPQQTLFCYILDHMVVEAVSRKRCRITLVPQIYPPNIAYWHSIVRGGIGLLMTHT